MKGKLKYSIKGYKKDSPDRFNDFNIIPSNKITMKGVNQPLLGISDTGDMKMMYPNQDYQFPGNSVTEFPIMQQGGVTPKDELIKIDGQWYNKDIIDGLERDSRIEQRKWNTNINRYGVVNEKQFYDKFPTEEHFILENQRKYANHLGSSRKYVPESEILMQQGGQVRQPIRGTREQYQAYQDSLSLYTNNQPKVNNYLNFIKSNNLLSDVYTPISDERIKPIMGHSIIIQKNLNGEFLVDKNRRPTNLTIQDLINAGIDKNTATYGVHEYKKPVQPIIYEPEIRHLQQRNINRRTLTNEYVEPMINTVQEGMQEAIGINPNIRFYTKKEQPIQLEPKKVDLLQSLSPQQLEFNPIPFAQGTYFSRERQNQELDSKQFGRKGKKDYFDKKTGKLLGTYKNGGKVSDWEIIFD